MDEAERKLRKFLGAVFWTTATFCGCAFLINAVVKILVMSWN